MTTENTQQQASTTPDATVLSFDDVFKELALEDAGKKPEEAPAAAPAEPVKAEETPAPAEAPAETPPAEEKPAEEAPKAPQEASTDDTDEVLKRLARLVKEEPAPAATAPETPAAEQPIYTKDEQEFLQSYDKDWPDISRAESLKRRAEYRELINYVFGEVAKELRPVVETVQALGNRTHLDDLRETVTDYEDVRDKVIDWVGSQPPYLQLAYKHVIQNGTVEEVADLVNRYKRETGAGDQAKPAPTPAPRKAETELPSATKQAAAELAPVSSKRAAVVTSAAPETFEDAFAMFADKV